MLDGIQYLNQVQFQPSRAANSSDVGNYVTGADGRSIWQGKATTTYSKKWVKVGFTTNTSLSNAIPGRTCPILGASAKSAFDDGLGNYQLPPRMSACRFDYYNLFMGIYTSGPRLWNKYSNSW